VLTTALMVVVVIVSIVGTMLWETTWALGRPERLVPAHL
jgi:hypothetical protein